MGKYQGFPGKMPNMMNLMKQAEKVKQDLEKKQEEAKQMEFSATSGGGAVKVKVSGSRQLKEISISEEIVDKEEVEMLQDLILVAVNDALKKANDYLEEGLDSLNLNGLM